jgi:predicted amidohydrolase/GNAT superfamily N-acetyltransferase
MRRRGGVVRRPGTLDLPDTKRSTMAKTTKKSGKESKKRRKSRRKGHLLVLRNTRPDDYPSFKRTMDAAYPTLGGAWKEDQFLSQIERFPEGQICIEDRGKVVAAAIALIVDYEQFGDQHSYEAISGNGYLTTHDPNGDTLYGVDIFVHPDYRSLRLGRRLYDARKALCERLNLKRIVAGGRIPGYRRHAKHFTQEEYIGRVCDKELHDPVLSFQLANGFRVRRMISGYEPKDKESGAVATLLEWVNIRYQPKRSLLRKSRRDIRLGVVQWQMRPAPTFAELLSQIEYFVDTIAGYTADFVMFPEFFNFPLMVQFNQDNPAEAIRELAGYTERLREEMLRMAVVHNINIIAGSMPEYDGQTLRNAASLLRRDGTWDIQHKLHITPDEEVWWGLKGGDALRAFDTDAGRIGILVCYDVEFPELSRLLAEQGMQILFVPYWTDTKNAYERVRRCAQARAIENECYVAITGSVGNLPNVENMDIQYSQAAVFTPSDYAFPHDAIVAEATPNTEMSLIADLDLEKLHEIRHHGSVRNWRDRRRDLYAVRWLQAKAPKPEDSSPQEADGVFA